MREDERRSDKMITNKLINERNDNNKIREDQIR